jgi:endonuclease/exonuclease/phosphatase family metal-dependent hydrolase
VNFATSKNLTVENTMFPIVTFTNLLEYILTHKPHDQIDHILVDRRRHSNILDVRPFKAADCDSDHYLLVVKVRKRLAVNKQRTHR